MANETAKTYGEFIAAMGGTECIYAQTFIEEWKALAKEEHWNAYRPLPLERQLVLNFAEDMASYFRNTISNTCLEELYQERIQAGHAFLRWVHEKAVAFGIDIKLEEIDAPLTPVESLIEAETDDGTESY